MNGATVTNAMNLGRQILRELEAIHKLLIQMQADAYGYAGCPSRRAGTIHQRRTTMPDLRYPVEILDAEDEAQAWAEKTEGWETCPVCDGHGQPEGDGHGWDGSSFHTPGCDFCDGMGAVPEDAVLLALVAEGGC